MQFAVRYIPDWCPGTQWRADGKIGRNLAFRMLYELYDVTKRKIVTLSFLVDFYGLIECILRRKELMNPALWRIFWRAERRRILVAGHR